MKIDLMYQVDVGPISPSQSKALALLIAGKSQKDVALAVGVNARTIGRWMREPAFVAALDNLKRAIIGLGYEEHQLSGVEWRDTK